MSVRGMESIPNLAGLSPWTRAEAARLLAAGGQVMGFSHTISPVKVPKGAKLSMHAANRGLIKELSMSLPRIPLAAPAAGTGIEMTNIDALLLLARCEQPNNSVKVAAKVFGADAGDVVIGGKKLKPLEVEKLLAERLNMIETTLLDKYAELGIISVEA